MHIVWLRHELRLHDNPVLYAAAEKGVPVLPVFIYPAGDGSGVGAASKWWLHHSLASLRKTLGERGSVLLIRQGAAHVELVNLAKQYGASAVFWSRAHTPDGRREDDDVEQTLRRDGIPARIFSSANFLIHPYDIMNKAGAPYKVFTPFWKHASAVAPCAPLPPPKHLASTEYAHDTGSIEALKLLPRHEWTNGLADTWSPGEQGAWDRLRQFLDSGIDSYADMRDFPGEEGVSRLSPYLHFGEISPRAIIESLENHCMEGQDAAIEYHAAAFRRQLYWREFAAYLLYHFPDMRNRPMRPEFNNFPWREDASQLRAWQQGRTGYPIVDAGMRELWATGWMHNRVRMIAGSFLVKHLLLPWQAGAAWFHDTLVDADTANNTLGWQWVGGCGPDAAPYFRIFNPTRQSERFDPNGMYVRRWIPELHMVEARYLHAPWNAPPDALRAAGVVLGEHYPHPLVDHKSARQRALDAFDMVKPGEPKTD